MAQTTMENCSANLLLMVGFLGLSWSNGVTGRTWKTWRKGNLVISENYEDGPELKIQRIQHI